MRITSSMYYDNLYGSNNAKLSQDLFDVNKQIASGLKIQYASDDVTTFTDTMRLDNELVTLGQVEKSVDSGYKVSEQTDTTLNDFNDSMTRMKTLLIDAANDTNDDASRDAIAAELRGLEDNLKSLANTSINGKYLFSGSATDVKPISDDGTYNGNDQALSATIGSNNKQQYNLTGADLFLGEEPSTRREITTNTVNKNLFDDSSLSSSDSIRDLMGDKNDNSPNTAYFYLRGTTSDGTAVKEKIALEDTSSIDNLLTEIGKAYGNSATSDVVNVTMNDSGEIVVEDKMKGSSKLDFHMVGAIDYDGDGDDVGTSDVDDIDDLNDGETVYPPDGDLYVKEFMKSDMTAFNEDGTKIEGLIYDREQFTKDGSALTANNPQIVKETNAFATSSTKLSEVADLSQGNDGTLDGTTFNFEGKNINGDTYSATIDLKSDANGGSTFTIDGNTYDIYGTQSPRAAIDADDMTYQQLTDVMNMIVTDNLPAGDSADDYDTAVKAASKDGDMELSYDGKINFLDLTSYDTQATMSLYDKNTNDFSADASGSVMEFNANNALTISDPKTDFFKTIDDIIKSVEEYKNYPDSSSGEPRVVGIENSIQQLDDLQDHVFKSQSLVGAQSNSLSRSLERTQVLEMSTISLRSDTIDTDLAEASLELSKLNNNYEAMLSTVGKVSKLSLVNYL